MNNKKRALVYAKQNGHPNASAQDALEKQTVRDLRAIAASQNISIPSKARKAEIIEALRENDMVIDESKLTPRQRRRLRKKANRG